jgi:hypothetical protein
MVFREWRSGVGGQVQAVRADAPAHEVALSKRDVGSADSLPPGTFQLKRRATPTPGRVSAETWTRAPVGRELMQWR